MKAPIRNGSYPIIKDGEKHTLVIGGRWRYEIYSDTGFRLYISDSVDTINYFLKDYSDGRLKDIQGFNCVVVGDRCEIIKDGFEYIFTSNDHEKFIRDNKAQINEYFSRREIDRVNKIIEGKMQMFRLNLKSQEEYVQKLVDSLDGVEQKDLFLSAAASSFAKSFEVIVAAFKEPKIKEQVRLLFNKFK